MANPAKMVLRTIVRPHVRPASMTAAPLVFVVVELSELSPPSPPGVPV